MPTIAIFNGIIIQMFFEHTVRRTSTLIYSGAKALIRISDGAVIRGKLPRKQANLVRDWVKLRHAELMENGIMRKRTAAASASRGPMIDVVSVKPMGGYTLRVGFSRRPPHRPRRRQRRCPRRRRPRAEPSDAAGSEPAPTAGRARPGRPTRRPTSRRSA